MHLLEPFNGDTVLHKLITVWQKDTVAAEKCLDILLQAGASVNQVNHEGFTPLQLAAMKSNSNFVLKLLQKD